MEPLVSLERQDGLPLHRQLTAQLRSALLDGRLAPGARLPSSRELAASLGISRTVVVAAYDELFAEGYVEGRHGSGTYVVDGLLPVARPALPPQPGGATEAPRYLRAEPPPAPPVWPAPDGVIEFRPGKPSTAQMPAAVWRGVWRSVSVQRPPDDYGPPAGQPRLRAAIADYVGVARGVRCTAGDVIVTAGTVQAIDLIARATIGPGDPVGVEEPGPPPARSIFAGHGARIVPLPVDEDGLRVTALPSGASAPVVVYVTPSHQYPLGGRLPIARRVALLDWARQHGSLIVEDDYDSEFRYGASPLPALAALGDRDHVVYVGTFSKVLTPALRTGYAVAPRPLQARLEALKPVTDFHSPWPVQEALATFIEEGHLNRHIRRVRRHYAANRAALLAALAPIADCGRPLGLEAGLHLCFELRSDLDPRCIAERARDGGVAVTLLDQCYVGRPDRRGLILGYGGLEQDEIERGAAVLVRAVRAEAERSTRRSGGPRIELASTPQ